MLGPVEVRTDDGPVDTGPSRQRCVLAALAVDVGRPVPVETVIARVWGDEPPRRARHALYVYITRIRRLLESAASTADGPVGIVRRNGGYQLEIPPERVDLHRFRRLVAQARDRSCADDRRPALLQEALELWVEAPPLGDLAGAWPTQVRQGWYADYLTAVMAWTQAMIRTDHAAETVARLTALVERHPLNEALVALLMRALHASGRGAEALTWFARTRTRLVEELGTDPGSDLRAAHQEVLHGDDQRSVPRAAGPPVPAQMPADLDGFVGRREALEVLDALFVRTARADGTAGGHRLGVVTGTPGVGKTTLALHWAHRVAHRFPGGHLYVNLRGFDERGRALAPAEAIRAFLDALGVPADEIPAGLEAQTALYRSLLADRRMLVLLDNARDTEQVRPLLPGSGGCVTLVTSRNELTGLVAAENAHPLRLDVLPVDEARELVAARLGHDRVAAEPEALAMLVAACARLPIALSIAAARARQTGFMLTAVAAELDGAGQRLDAFDTGDASGQVRAVFSWSYAALTAPAARLFRLLGVHPGPDISAAAAASLAGQSLAEIRGILAELRRANLVGEGPPGRYAFHDLLRSYAGELAQNGDPPEDRRAAAIRVLDHYTHSAQAADRLFSPSRNEMPLPLSPPAPGVTPERPADLPQALAWLTAERAVLVACLDQADHCGFDSHTWHLAWFLDTQLRRRGEWRARADIWLTAQRAADHLGDLRVRAAAYRALGHTHTMLGQADDAHRDLDQALDLCTQAGDAVGAADVLTSLQFLFWRQGRVPEALDHTTRALAMFREAGDVRGEAFALNAIGWFQSLLDQHAEAIATCTQALALFQRVSDPIGEANTWDSLGMAHHRAGQHTKSAACYERAVAVYRNQDDRYELAATLTRLGDAHHAAGATVAAGDAWRQALDILTELRHGDADVVRTKLAALTTAT